MNTYNNMELVCDKYQTVVSMYEPVEYGNEVSGFSGFDINVNVDGVTVTVGNVYFRVAGVVDKELVVKSYEVYKKPIRKVNRVLHKHNKHLSHVKKTDMINAVIAGIADGSVMQKIKDAVQQVEALFFTLDEIE